MRCYLFWCPEQLIFDLQEQRSMIAASHQIARHRVHFRANEHILDVTTVIQTLRHDEVVETPAEILRTTLEFVRPVRVAGIVSGGVAGTKCVDPRARGQKRGKGVALGLGEAGRLLVCLQ